MLSLIVQLGDEGHSQRQTEMHLHTGHSFHHVSYDKPQLITVYAGLRSRLVNKEKSFLILIKNLNGEVNLIRE